MEAKIAFLYDDLHETIYMKQPKGFKVFVCKLHRSLYGVRQSPMQMEQKV